MAIIESLQALVQQFGLTGLFVVVILANATVFITIPIDLIIVAPLAASGVYNPLLLGLVVGVGAAIGELTAYFVGLGGLKALEKFEADKLQGLHALKNRLKENENKGMVIILLGAAFPFPFDLIGMAAGLAEYSLPKFFLSAAVGKTIRFTVVSLAFFYGFEALKAFI